MPKIDLHDVGGETVSGGKSIKPVDTSSDAEHLAKEKHFGMVQFTADGFPHIPSIHSMGSLISEVRAEFKHAVSQEMKDVEAQKEIDESNIKSTLSQYMGNVKIHMQEFISDYLAEHPDGAGLKKAVLTELNNGFGNVGSGIAWVDNTNKVLMQGLSNLSPEIQAETAAHLGVMSNHFVSQAVTFEYKAGEEYRKNVANFQFATLKNDMVANADCAADLPVFASRFSSIAAGLLPAEKEAFLMKNKLDFQNHFCKCLRTKNPDGFIDAVKNNVFNGLIDNSVLENNRKIAEQDKAKNEIKRVKELRELQKKTLILNSKGSREELEAKIVSEPWSVGDDEIKRAILTPGDRRSVMALKKKVNKEYLEKDALDVEMSNDLLLGNGIASYPAQAQKEKVSNLLVPSEDNKSAPIDIVKSAERLGAKCEGKIYANALIANMLHSEDKDTVFQNVQGLSYAFHRNQPIIGDLNKHNRLYAKELVLAADCLGIPLENCTVDDDVVVDQVVQLRDRFVTSLKKNADKKNEEVNANTGKRVEVTVDGKFRDSESQNGYEEARMELLNDLGLTKTTKSWFGFGAEEKSVDDDVQDASSALRKRNYDEYNEAVSKYIGKGKGYVNEFEKKHLLEKFDDTFIHNMPVYRKHWNDIAFACKMAESEFRSKCKPTCIYGGSELMYYPPELQIPGSDVPGSSSQNSLLLRVSSIASEVEKMGDTRLELKYLNPVVVKQLTDATPLISTDAKNVDLVCLPDSIEYNTPIFKCKYKDTGKTFDAYLVFEKSDDDDKSYFVYLYNSADKERIPVRKHNVRYRVNFNDQKLLQKVKDEFYKVTTISMEEYKKNKKVNKDSEENNVNG